MEWHIFLTSSSSFKSPSQFSIGDLLKLRDSQSLPIQNFLNYLDIVMTSVLGWKMRSGLGIWICNYILKNFRSRNILPWPRTHRFTTDRVTYSICFSNGAWLTKDKRMKCCTFHPVVYSAWYSLYLIQLKEFFLNWSEGIFFILVDQRVWWLAGGHYSDRRCSAAIAIPTATIRPPSYDGR